MVDLLSQLSHRAMIVTCATICWEARDEETGQKCPVKDAWRASWRAFEGDLLHSAHKDSVFSIATPITHGDVKGQCAAQEAVDTIVHVRQCLSYNEAKKVEVRFKKTDRRRIDCIGYKVGEFPLSTSH